MAIKRINLPKDAWGLLQLKGVKKQILGIFHKLADWFGFWNHPKDIALDVKSLKFGAYWVYKTMNPIVRGKKNSGLENYFETHREKPTNLLPQGFEVITEHSMSVVGDLMCTAGAENSKDLIYEHVADLIFDADISFANLESTLTTQSIGEIQLSQKDTPKINMNPAQYEALIQHRGRQYDLVQLANNHILDCGEEGINTTLKQLNKDKLPWIGVNETPKAFDQGVIMEHNGLKIGWVAFTYSVNLRPFPEDKPYIVNMVPFHLEDDPNTAPVVKQIQWCKSQGCDLVVLCLHWGLEFELFPHPNQLAWAHSFAEAGADIIVGHHPHVPQPMEFYRTQRDVSRVVPIFYSLGNLTPIMSGAATVLSLIGRLTLAKGRYKGNRQTYVSNVDLIPVAMVSDTDGGGYGLRLFKVAELYRMTLDKDMSSYVSDIAAYADGVLGNTWRNNL